MRLPSNYDDNIRYSGGFKVQWEDEEGLPASDTVYFTGYTRREAYESLVNHDGYLASIEVYPPQDGRLPLTMKQEARLCEDNGVRIVQATEPEVFGRWDWIHEDGENASDMSFDTEQAAITNAVETLGLDFEDEE